LLLKNYIFNSFDAKNLQLLLHTTLFGAIASNIIAPIVFLYIIKNYATIPFMAVWFSLQLLLFVLKLQIVTSLKKLISISSYKIKKQTYLLFATIIASSLLNTSLVIYSVWHQFPYDILLMLAIVIITLSAGSITTLLPVYKFYFIYVLFNMLPLIIISFFHCQGILEPLFVILTIFTIVILKAGYQQYLSLQNLIALEEEKSLFQEELKSRVVEEVEKNRQKDKAMIQQSKMAQMGEMMSMIAHQWRQPLSAISAATTALELKLSMDKLDKETGKKLTTNIKQYTQHLSDTIDDFRNFFKETKKKEKITLSQLVQETLTILQLPLEQKNITIEQHTLQECFCLTYTNEFKQVLFNIIKNAEDALIANKIQNPKITITINCNTIQIEDNGGGIDPAIIDKIFDPYFSTKTKKDGTGLGLYMSKTIIYEHCHGSLDVVNGKEGALFTIKIDKIEN
jgi:signal transduction histidine kinase